MGSTATKHSSRLYRVRSPPTAPRGVASYRIAGPLWGAVRIEGSSASTGRSGCQVHDGRLARSAGDRATTQGHSDCVTYDPQSGAYQPGRQPVYGPGNQAPDSEQMPAHTVPAAGKKSKTPLILAILAALLVLCCGGTAIAVAVGMGQPKTTTPAPTATTALSTSGSPAPAPAPATTAPAAPVVAATTHQPAPPPTTKTPPAPPTTPSYQRGVHPGAFCSPRGAFGYTVTGVLMQCKPSATDSRNRWRAA